MYIFHIDIRLLKGAAVGGRYRKSRLWTKAPSSDCHISLGGPSAWWSCFAKAGKFWRRVGLDLGRIPHSGPSPLFESLQKNHCLILKVLTVARAFIELGLEPFHTVAILGHNDPCWHMRSQSEKTTMLTIMITTMSWAVHIYEINICVDDGKEAPNEKSRSSNLAAVHAGGFATGIYQTNRFGLDNQGSDYK